MRQLRALLPLITVLKGPQVLACQGHGDCNDGEYCDANGNCFSCTYVSASNCDAIDDGTSPMGSCCTAQFLHACPSNPRLCSCQRHTDCAAGWYCSDAVASGGALICRPCDNTAPSSSVPIPSNRRSCAAIGSRCCSRDYLRQCPSAPQRCSCTRHDDCVLGMYCAQGGYCRTCTEGVNSTHCASFDNDCCSAAFLEVHCNDPQFPAVNMYGLESNPRVDPHRCRSRMSWAPCPVGSQPNKERTACESCADGWSSLGGSLSDTCSRCEPGRAGTGGLCDIKCKENEQPTYNRLQCESCQSGRTSTDGTFCQCSGNFEPVGLDCHEVQWIRWRAAGLIALVLIASELIGACAYSCAKNNVRTPLQAAMVMADLFCASPHRSSFAAIGAGATLCGIGTVYLFYCAAAACNLTPPIPLILGGGFLCGLAIRHLFSIGPRIVTVTCPPGVLGGSVLRVDDRGQPVLNAYGDPIVDAGPALNRILFSSYAVRIPDDVIPGQQFTISIESKDPGPDGEWRWADLMRCNRCQRSSNAVMHDYDYDYDYDYDDAVTKSPAAAGP
eukprot:COSAG02_NODE_9095_length_2333_cov_2.237243_2_plen_556_part_00